MSPLLDQQISPADAPTSEAKLYFFIWIRFIGFYISFKTSVNLIHGDNTHVAGRLDALERNSVVMTQLRGKRIGVIGRPSDRLISSVYDSDAVMEKLGMTIVDIPVQELIDVMLYYVVQHFDGQSFEERKEGSKLMAYMTLGRKFRLLYSNHSIMHDSAIMSYVFDWAYDSF